MFSDYSKARDWLESYIPLIYGKEELGLARIEELLKRLGNPERKFKSIHVAGTSGKGSTAFYIARLLQRVKESKGARGVKVGLHVSPHLGYIGERMQILQRVKESRGARGDKEIAEPISEEKLIKLIELIKPIVEAIQKEKPELTPSYFEILVAASFLYFAQEKVDWAVVEVGLGGRLDATNVLMPEVSVITNVGLDHTEILGDTIEKIAWEKAGIIKESKSQRARGVRENTGVPVVTAAKGEALEVIRRVAAGKKAQLIEISNFKFPISNFQLKHCTKETAGLAIAVVEVALGYSSSLLIPSFPRKRESRKRSFASQNQQRTGSPIRSGMTDDFKVSSHSVRTINKHVIEQAFSVGFAGRFEEITPGVILDGAHNPDKIRALIEFVRKSKVESRESRVTLVVAFKKGKDWQAMIDLLIKNLPVEQVIATEFQAVTDTGAFAAVPAEEIAAYVKSKSTVKVESISNSQEAVWEALSRVRETPPEASLALKGGKSHRVRGLVLVTGSLYLVGEVRTMWELFD